jgi:hypothetical protein
MQVGVSRAKNGNNSAAQSLGSQKQFTERSSESGLGVESILCSEINTFPF